MVARSLLTASRKRREATVVLESFFGLMKRKCRPAGGGRGGAENAAVGVDLVEHDEFQRRKIFLPFFVKGQHAHVEHVWVGDDDGGRVSADFFALVVRGVAVVNLGGHA